MKRIIYSGITKTIVAVLLLFCCTATMHYGFLTLRAPILYGNTETVYETRQYSEIFAKYIDRTAVYTRYREEGYSLSTSADDSELALLLDGGLTDEDLEEALYNVYDLNETAFYYYHSIINEVPSNYQYYVVNQKTGAVYASENFIRYANETSGSIEAFLEEGILNENVYVILNTGNNRTMTRGGNTDVLNRSNLLWSIDFLHHDLDDMEEDTYYDTNYSISVGNNDSGSPDVSYTITDVDALKNVTEITEADAFPPNGPETMSPKEPEPTYDSLWGTENLLTAPDASRLEPIAPPASEPPTAPENGPYLLYAFVTDNLVTDEFTRLGESFVAAKQDFTEGLQSTVIFTLLSVFLFTICNVLSGRRGDSKTIHLHFYDRIFTEVILVALLALFLLPYILWTYVAQPYLGTSVNDFLAYYSKYNHWMPIFLGIMVLFLFIASILYFSLIRRFKARILLSSSLVGRFLILPCAKLIKRFIGSTREFLANLPALWKTILYLGIAAVWLSISVLLLFIEPIVGLVILVLGAGICAFICLRNMLDHTRIIKGAALMSMGDLSTRIPTEAMLPSNKRLSEDINQICDGLNSAVAEQTKSERMKTELITNVSHDIKTPLTSIINYIELIKNELPQEGEVAEYAEILSQKSWRLKGLIDDLVEASKAASGTMKLDPIRFNAVELLRQAVGDFEERLSERNLTLCMTLPETPVNVLADGACTHRIIENMLSNVCKYALSGTRVFVSLDLPEGTGLALLTIKNTSAAVLSKTPEELLTRFSRGDDARSDEGSGLGLSIAESLAALQGGSFYVEIDGDLFKAKLTIPLAE